MEDGGVVESRAREAESAESLTRDEIERRLAEAELSKATAEAALGRLRLETRQKEFAALAAGFENLPINPQAFGEVLRECADRLTPETYAELQRVLKAADAAGASVFEVLGRDGGAPTGTAYERATAAAKQLIAEGKEKTLYNALARVWDENPALYKEHVAERREGSRTREGTR